VLAAVGEVLPGVVDDLVGADRAHQIHLASAGHPGDRGSEGLGQLHGVGADAPRGTDDQNLLPGCDAPGVQAFDGGEPGDRDHGGLLEAQPGGLAHQFVRSRGGVFGERAAGDAKHLIAGPEPADVGAGRGDRARHVQPGDTLLRPPEPEAQDPHQVRLATHQMTRAPVHARRPHPHENLADRDNGLVDL